MDKNIFEEGPRRGHAAGDTSIEQQASQLASDIKYKARQKMKGKSGSNMSPGQVQQLYRSLLSSSPAPGAVKSIVKKKLFGEQVDPGITPVSEHVKDSASSVFTKVFLEGADQKFIVRVTDKATGNTSYRKADRAKIAELRANKNISSVEITGRKKADDAYDSGKGGKKAKKDYDGDGKVESGSKEHAGVVHNAIQRKKGGVADGQDTRKEEYVDEGLRSAVKRLLGKKDAPAEKKPESRGEQLRKKYNVGPEKSDTSAKRQILNRTRAKAERDKKQYGGSVYTKKVADKSKAAHDRYLKAGYSKYGAGDARGKGNKARRRAEALKKEDFNWLVDTLISEGYNLSAYTVDQFYDFCEEVIYEKEGDIPEKKITGKGVNNSKRVKVFPNSMSEQAPMTADKPDPAQKRREQQNDRARQQEVQILQKKLQALRSSPKGSDPSIMASYEAEGEVVEQKDVVRYCPKCDKDETREECRYGGEYWDENSKPAKGEDVRELPTKMDLFKNKLRARGIKVAGITPAPRNMKTYDDLGEGMTMKDFKKQRSRQKQKEKRADEKTSPLRRAGIHADKASPERAARHRANVDPDFDYGPAADERNYPGGKLRPNKVRKAKALGELGESAVDRAEYEKIAKEPAPKDDKKAAYAFKDNKDRQRDLKKLARLVRHADGQRRNPAMYNSFEPEGEMTESAEDRARDEHQMRGGMAARVDYDRPPAKKLSNAELGIKPGKTWVQKQMEKK